MHHLNSAIYGDPQYPLNQTPQQQFIRGASKIGRGQYRAYNPTGPITVGVKWQWAGDLLETFREDWKTPSMFNYGNNWFTIDLPLFLDYTLQPDAFHPYSIDATLVYSALSGFVSAGGGVNNNVAHLGDNVVSGADNVVTVGIDGTYGYVNPVYATGVGQFSSTRFLDSNVMQFTVRADGSWALVVVGEEITGNPSSILGLFTNSNEEIVLNRSGSQYVSAAGSAPIAAASWSTEPQVTQMIAFKVKVPEVQRYVAHFTSPFNAALIGYNLWEVSANLEIDVSKALSI